MAATPSGRAPTRNPLVEAPWVEFDDHALMGVQLRDLALDWRQTWLADRVADLYADLERRGLRFRPHVWLGEEWMSPVGVPGIAIPFYLAHPRLMRLERSMMLEVEGGTHSECKKILRHEAGHAIQQAYRLHRRRRWQRVFGQSSKPYPDFYRPDPTSRKFVQHLRMYYAQSHPDEDFAETFAVWLAPGSAWRKRYAGWPALDKLEYVDELMAEIGELPAPVRSRRQVEPVGRSTRTLGEHYEDKLERYPTSAPDLYDRQLRQLFKDEPRDPGSERAWRFLRRKRGSIRRAVARWTGEYQFAVDQVLEDMIQRCRQLDLVAVGDEDQLLTDAVVMLTVCTMHFLYSEPAWIPV